MFNRIKVLSILNIVFGFLGIPYILILGIGISSGIESSRTQEIVFPFLAIVGSTLLITSGILLWRRNDSAKLLSISALIIMTVPFWVWGIYQNVMHPETHQMFKNFNPLLLVLPIGSYGAPNPFFLTIYLMIQVAVFRSSRFGFKT